MTTYEIALVMKDIISIKIINELTNNKISANDLSIKLNVDKTTTLSKIIRMKKINIINTLNKGKNTYYQINKNNLSNLTNTIRRELL